jgi:hypothetical protein
MAVPYLGEGLMAPGLIRMFGREFEGLKLAGDMGSDPSSNNQLAMQHEINELKKKLAELEKKDAAPESAEAEPKAAEDLAPRLARIYGFAYLGNYYKLANPPVLRVFGPGFPVQAGFHPENSMDILGVEFKDEDFVGGISMWPSDHLDVAVRIDITIGWLREVLLDSDMSTENNVTSSSSGGRADVVGRDSGLVGRDSGLVGRDSGFVGRSRR